MSDKLIRITLGHKANTGNFESVTFELTGDVDATDESTLDDFRALFFKHYNKFMDDLKFNKNRPDPIKIIDLSKGVHTNE